MNIKELRNKIGISQQELADNIGVPKSRLAQWEVNKARPKTRDHENLIKFFTEKGVLKEEFVAYDGWAAVRKIEKTTEVILSAVAEILARQTNQSATIVRGDLERLVNERLSSQELEQSADAD